MARSYLCVGGPKAGQRVAVRDGVRVIKVSVNLHVVEYWEQTVVGDDPTGKYESVTVWAPTTQDPRQTLELLLDTYERHQTRRIS
jgi:hypothetical protein